MRRNLTDFLVEFTWWFMMDDKERKKKSEIREGYGKETRNERKSNEKMWVLEESPRKEVRE